MILIIDSIVRKQIKNLIYYAEQNIRFEALIDDENFVCVFSGYRCVYYIREHNKTLFKNLSISFYPLINKIPCIEVVTMIMFEFGFPKNMEHVDRFWIEKVNNIPVAVNVLKKHN